MTSLKIKNQLSLKQRLYEENDHQSIVELISIINVFILEQALKADRLVNNDISFLIYMGHLFIMQERYVARRRGDQEIYGQWTINHPNLNDKDGVENNFKTLYRISKRLLKNLSIYVFV
ncbi:hypothetical protein PHYBLDRAFT_173708 [Phycomyces blakesleeanus NRRL 1555(-)]|uniref:Uncharacterized protein n=1 Tax=Phycomyces blakesleeanus (strain ATCC 8743b / DSM 1359 / FGSC 10004 / NBRC 33097 / NRRL 1555) TaxID=763407 RepID=A0A167KCY0_PHYB8|nr:hypothetical protein PHYBLDRAFT_173708 [Phycomyces blakesleeanus NRRL 1555(-)]OAD67789.1 hypothetical protein PHYBLDRAFT_173708 [Phycomyces blakesleeanus NRRL 1555(-)]|eukprot:XP_018285829.1 hypothetical protein PHYBLDRAFT_173708 [Phycomyces blakesleeanus NRRL 1555(-)]